ncbi:MAG: hypothetical protein R3F28_12470 [Candidatus Kapaibacterium sp.]
MGVEEGEQAVGEEEDSTEVGEPVVKQGVAQTGEASFAARVWPNPTITQQTWKCAPCRPAGIGSQYSA